MGNTMIDDEDDLDDMSFESREALALYVPCRYRPLRRHREEDTDEFLMALRFTLAQAVARRCPGRICRRRGICVRRAESCLLLSMTEDFQCEVDELLQRPDRRIKYMVSERLRRPLNLQTGTSSGGKKDLI